MEKNNKRLNLISQGLSYKLKISFHLMIVLPILVSIYLVSTYIVPHIGIKLDIVMAIVASLFIAAIGFFLIKEVFGRILSVTTEAKLIAAGDINRKVASEADDEVGDLGAALNQLTDRIRLNVDELKGYSEKTSRINVEMQKRVMVLSSLLQISSLISQSAKLDDILHVATEKSRLLASSEAAYLLFRQEGQNYFYTRLLDANPSKEFPSARIEPSDQIYTKLNKSGSPLILDAKNNLPESARSEVYAKFGMVNLLAFPVILRGKVTAILGVGNNELDFAFGKEDIELLDILAKQVAIAIENDILVRKVEKLEIKDALTGLYNEVFIRNRLQEEIKRAIIYQRPCAFIILNVDNFHAYHEKYGALQAESALKQIGALIRESVSEIERVARFGDNEFAVVLPEKNKRQAREIADKIRKKIESNFGSEAEKAKQLTISGSVSENPLDGIDAGELITKARLLLAAAKAQGKNKVII
ncbi:MAG: diguanylate cyclase [Candidatus Omnitrophota bacterium]